MRLKRCPGCLTYQPRNVRHWRWRRSGTIVTPCLDCLRRARRIREAERRQRDPVEYLAKRAAQARKERAAHKAR